MASDESTLKRAITAFPLVVFGHLLFPHHGSGIYPIIRRATRTQPGKIHWESSSITILQTFHHIDFFNDLWRGTTVAFAPSALGFDAVSSWQMFSFLIDLSAVHAIWLCESARYDAPIVARFSVELNIPSFSDRFYNIVSNQLRKRAGLWFLGAIPGHWLRRSNLLFPSLLTP